MCYSVYLYCERHEQQRYQRQQNLRAVSKPEGAELSCVKAAVSKSSAEGPQNAAMAMSSKKEGTQSSVEVRPLLSSLPTQQQQQPLASGQDRSAAAMTRASQQCNESLGHINSMGDAQPATAICPTGHATQQPSVVQAEEAAAARAAAARAAAAAAAAAAGASVHLPLSVAKKEYASRMRRVQVMHFSLGWG